jgi:hypothetical protein
MADLNVGAKPDGIVEVFPGCKKTHAVVSLCSQLGMDEKTANTWLVGLPRDNARIV